MMKRNQPKSLRICDTVLFESIRPGVCVTGVTKFFFVIYPNYRYTHEKIRHCPKQVQKTSSINLVVKIRFRLFAPKRVTNVTIRNFDLPRYALPTN